MIKAIGIALTGLDGASKRLNASASNVANIGTTGSLKEDGKAPYTPVTTSQKTNDAGGVQTSTIPRAQPFVPSYAPDSPFADENGIIGAPNISLAEEAVNAKVAELSYKANIEVIKTTEEMENELLDILGKDD